MSEVYNMHEAKTHLSRLAERASHGEEIVIARNGHALARLVPIEEPRKRCKLGFWKDEEVWPAPVFRSTVCESWWIE